jgi:hypothetical protein
VATPRELHAHAELDQPSSLKVAGAPVCWAEHLDPSEHGVPIGQVVEINPRLNGRILQPKQPDGTPGARPSQCRCRSEAQELIRAAFVGQCLLVRPKYSDGNTFRIADCRSILMRYDAMQALTIQ